MGWGISELTPHTDGDRAGKLIVIAVRNATMGTQKKFTRADAAAIGRALDIITMTMEPIPPSVVRQRQTLEALMPRIHALRQQGQSFATITEMLNQAGLKLSIAEVRTHYFDQVADARY